MPPPSSFLFPNLKFGNSGIGFQPFCPLPQTAAAAKHGTYHFQPFRSEVIKTWNSFVAAENCRITGGRAGTRLFLSIPSLLSVEAGHTFVLPAPDALLSKTGGGIQADGHSYGHRTTENASAARKMPFPVLPGS
ncbi:MAG: hypothetical protein OSJ58_18255 [Dysosmobacter sp.]|nr:hypothetical protein [Dysosmobacter sp.]